MKIYTINKSDLGITILRIDDDGRQYAIPDNPANSDYQRYLRWLEDPTAEEGGTLK